MKLLSLFSDKLFFKATFKLALPIALQNLILSSLNLVDTIIIGGLGETAIASVGLANQYFFLLNILLFGVISGSSIFTAQYWGRRDLANIKRVLGLCLLTSIAASTLFTLGGLLFPKQIIGIFSKDIKVIEMGGSYLRIIVLSYVVTALTMTFSFTLRSTGSVKSPMIVSITALGINTFLNYALVYGLFGFPAIGVSGSAIATSIARFIEFGLILFVVYGYKHPIAGTLKEMLDLTSSFVKRFYKVTVPVILNEGVWALGMTVYAAVYARMSTEVVASTNIVGTIERLAMVVFLGFGNAAAVMIGNKIGEEDNKSAFEYALRFIILNTLFGALMGILIYTAAPLLLSAYNVSPAVHNYSKNILHILAFFLWVKVFNYTNIVGILRSGGDTRFCLFLDIGGMWLVGVPLVVLGGLYWHLPIHIVFIFVYLEEVAKLVIGLPRIASKKWINNLAVH
jgi:putative MATE family efflux protein